MDTINIFWDPSGSTLDKTSRKTYSGPPADGDTPYLRMPIRMLSVDTPETSYPTIGKPSNSDARLLQLANWLKNGDIRIDPGLKDHLVPRLETGQAGSLQQQQGEAAKAALKQLLDDRLTRPSGSKRSLYVRTSNTPIDSYGRMLAYIAPSYSSTELPQKSIEERYTFNLGMVANGWAAPLIIYPSIPKHSDLKLMQEKSKEAVDLKKGAWANDLMLTAYEWRMCIKLYKQAKKLMDGTIKSISSSYWISRYVLDMTTRKIYYPQKYYLVKPYNRLFVWKDDVQDAVAQLNLMSGE